MLPTSTEWPPVALTRAPVAHHQTLEPVPLMKQFLPLPAGLPLVSYVPPVQVQKAVAARKPARAGDKTAARGGRLSGRAAAAVAPVRDGP